MDELIIAIIIGSSWSIHFFMRHVGIRSRSQVLFGEEIITSQTSSQLAGFMSCRWGVVFDKIKHVYFLHYNVDDQNKFEIND